MSGAGYKLFNTGDVLLASEVNTYLMQQTVMVFANASARTTALSGVLAEGMLSYLADTNATEVYDGSSWVSVSGTGDITAVTTGANSGLAGGVTTGNADIKINFASKGQLAVGTGSGTTDFLNVGTDGHTLVADSSVSPTGVKWAVDPVADVVTTAGDILYATAADTLTRLGIGTAGQVLKVNSGATAPEWGAAAAASFVGCGLKKTSDQSISDDTTTAITFTAEDFDTDAFHSTSTNTARITIPSGKGGKYLIYGYLAFQDNATGSRAVNVNLNGTTRIATFARIQAVTESGSNTTIGGSFIYNLVAGDYIELQGYQKSTGSLNVLGSAAPDDWRSRFGVYYLGA